jgi:hypothetical protein
MSDEVAAAIIGLGGALIGGVLTGGVSLWQAARAERARQETRRREHLIGAFQYFDGKTQRRNIGVSIVEAYWAEMPTLRAMFVPLLAGQAVYLLTQSEQPDDAELEYVNLDRMMHMLGDMRSRSEFADQYHKLDSILKRKAERGYSRGLTLDEDQLQRYQEFVASAPT